MHVNDHTAAGIWSNMKWWERECDGESTKKLFPHPEDEQNRGKERRKLKEGHNKRWAVMNRGWIPIEQELPGKWSLVPRHEHQILRMMHSRMFAGEYWVIAQADGCVFYALFLPSNCLACTRILMSCPSGESNMILCQTRAFLCQCVCNRNAASGTRDQENQIPGESCCQKSSD